jgi:hypothetical protein
VGLGEPIGEVVTVAVAHHPGEGADVFGGGAELGIPGEDALDLERFLGGQAVGVSGDPAGTSRTEGGLDEWHAGSSPDRSGRRYSRTIVGWPRNPADLISSSSA